MKNVLKLLAVALIMFLMVASISIGGWDTTPQPKPAEDAIDSLVITPVAILNKFGHTERTRIIYNIARLLDVCRAYETRIKTLETQFAELKATVVTIDPNNVEEIPYSLNTKRD